MPREASLYKRVEHFAKNSLGCQFAKQQVGTRLGKIDVAGVRELRGDFESDAEVVAIEVKEERAAFLNAIGQAVAYSIYAHRCYLAVRRRRGNSFTDEERQVATQFGVGLIEIGSNKFSMPVTPRRFSPENRNVLQIIHRLGLFRCAPCRAVYEDADRSDINQSGQIYLPDNSKYRGQLLKILQKGKHARYYLYNLHHQRDDKRRYVYDKRYLCQDCVSLFASLVPRGAKSAG